MVPLNQRFVKNVGNYSESAARDFSSLLYIYILYIFLYILYIYIHSWNKIDAIFFK